MSELKLRLQLEGETEKTVAVNKDGFIVGRLPECDLCLPFLEISRYHARFNKAEDGSWQVEDLGSLNGTRLNERPLTAPQKIKHGDAIQLGHTSLSVLLPEATKPGFAARGSQTDGMTILRNVKDLQEQWIQGEAKGEETSNPQIAIARLRDLVEIAKGLNSAESIEAIFSKVQEVVFRNLKSIDRLALLIDTNYSGKLEMLNAAARQPILGQNLATDASWISRSICQKVFADRVAIKIADAQMDERFEGEHSILAKGIRSALAVPLWDENKVVGVLYADARISFNQWNRGGDEDLSFFSALGNLVASSVQRWLLAQKLRSEENIRHRLERYHSPAVVQQMMSYSDLSDARIIPIERDITILFADLVGFTAISERLRPAQIAQMLNAFFEEMLQEIFAVGGTLDKFIGDCIMAFFGAPEPQTDHADRAVIAARGMLERLEKLNAKNFFIEPLQLRVAVNSGRAVVGDVGSSQRVDYTALGATINLAARMETICPQGQCVISEATFSLLQQKQGFKPVGEQKFRGINRPIKLYLTTYPSQEVPKEPS